MISTKDRAKLRGIAQKLEPTVLIGKAGLEQAIFDEIVNVLEKHEIAKIRLLPNSGLDTKTAMQEICKNIFAEPVQQIGNVVVIYRKSSKKDAKHIL